MEKKIARIRQTMRKYGKAKQIVASDRMTRDDCNNAIYHYGKYLRITTENSKAKNDRVYVLHARQRLACKGRS